MTHAHLTVDMVLKWPVHHSLSLAQESLCNYNRPATISVMEKCDISLVKHQKFFFLSRFHSEMQLKFINSRSANEKKKVTERTPL